MLILFRCPSCGARLRADDEAAERQVRCGHCNELAEFPREETEPVTVAVAGADTSSEVEILSALRQPNERFEAPVGDEPTAAGTDVDQVAAPEISTAEGDQTSGTVPALVRIYGIVLMLLAGTGMYFLMGAASDGKATLRFAALFLFALANVIVWNKLRQGERWAVDVLRICAVFAFLGAIVSGVITFGAYDLLGDRLAGFIVGGSFLLLVVYLPPLISAYRHWEDFEPMRSAPRENAPRLVRACEAMLGSVSVPVVLRAYGILLTVSGVFGMAVCVWKLRGLAIKAEGLEGEVTGPVDASSLFGPVVGFVLALVQVLVWDRLRRTSNEGSVASLVQLGKDVGEYIWRPGKAGKPAPLVLRAYGVVFLLASVAGMALCLVNLRYKEVRLLCASGFVLLAAHAWVSNELRRASRWAVQVMKFVAIVLVAFPVFCGVVVLGAGVLPAEDIVLGILVVGPLVIVPAIYLPLLISARRHRKAEARK